MSGASLYKLFFDCTILVLIIMHATFLADIFQKLFSESCNADHVVNSHSGLLGWLVCLLQARDLTVLQCSLCALINISKRCLSIDCGYAWLGRVARVMET